MKCTIFVTALLLIATVAFAETQVEQHQKAAFAAWEKGDTELSIKEFREAVKLAPKDTLLRDQLIFVLDEKIKKLEEQLKEAQGSLTKLINSQPAAKPNTEQPTGPQTWFNISGCRINASSPRATDPYPYNKNKSFQLTGYIQNASGVSYGNVSVWLAAFDRKGNQIITTQLQKGNLGPGERWRFTYNTFSSNIHRFEVTQVEGYPR